MPDPDSPSDSEPDPDSDPDMPDPDSDMPDPDSPSDSEPDPDSDPDMPDPDLSVPVTSDPDPVPHMPHMPDPLESIKRSLCLPRMIQKADPYVKLQIYKLTSTPSTSLVVTHCLTISSDLSWSLFVQNQEITSDKCPLLFGIPDHLTSESATSFLKVIDKLEVCAGQPDLKFVEFIQSQKAHR